MTALEYAQADPLSAALAYARRGWPVFPCWARSKEPATRRGFKNATTDLDVVRRMFRKPDLNVAIACGWPGPQVLDVDDLVAGHVALMLVAGLGGPDVATARGRQFYLQGSERGTVDLGYGELRGRGAYVVAPPSIHPSGKSYVWVVRPTDAPLPRVPDGIVPEDIKTAGAGEQPVVEGLVPYGQRHPHLRGVAVRLARAGMTDERRLIVHLRAEFEHFCEPEPPPKPGDFEQLAKWAAGSHIADRERALDDFAARWRGVEGVAP